jgi:hypothetical protein
VFAVDDGAAFTGFAGKFAPDKTTCLYKPSTEQNTILRTLLFTSLATFGAGCGVLATSHQEKNTANNQQKQANADNEMRSVGLHGFSTKGNCGKGIQPEG